MRYIVTCENEWYSYIEPVAWSWWRWRWVPIPIESVKITRGQADRMRSSGQIVRSS